MYTELKNNSITIEQSEDPGSFRYAMVVEYDGSSYAGSQRQPDRKTVQSELENALKNKGILVLQDDRGSIFTEYLFKKFGFEKLIKETPIIFKDKKGKDLGWNVIVVYRKIK